ncbi:hypothetical protein DL1_01050 [Thioclava dalianensis]|uniref:Uncharacterized protein n=1 Tax=Thioclava dalianensis TaxID=1185766 RepID=A0A074TIT7_9RHOB|nr:DUF1800 domain-containing protein [Thioclava dalianensis]KEP71626.1 hypothetical protein DL1_01050 [Thioclava dalianensis]SFN42727.1 Uncharacterized conserved protein, DUF1800 family [Thioclava dalianensis]
MTTTSSRAAPSQATLAAIRFGYGLSPDQPAPRGPAALLDQLKGPDTAAQQFPVPDTALFLTHLNAMKTAQRARRQKEPGAEEAVKTATGDLSRTWLAGMRGQMARAAFSDQGFRERLAFFWCDHFTVVSKTGPTLLGPDAFAEDAIRPHLATTFPQMLRAAVTHPAMLLYLDQNRSVGPQSKFGLKRHVGLNENLGRELMELHTLGVGAPYTQTDVRQLAKLLTGLGFNSQQGFVFHPNWAQPGAETVLGKRYGGETPAKLSDIYDALDDIALNPATAHHLAHKLAVHFVSDSPDPAFVAHIAQRYSATKGDLPATYAALLEHPAAWAPRREKTRQPWDFLAASLRAMAPPADLVARLDDKKTRQFIRNPLTAMGQRYQSPNGPNGWAEDARAWITPQALSDRINWSMRMSSFLERYLPDPRVFLHTALGDAASPALITAAARASNKREGNGLILASADFNRR